MEELGGEVGSVRPRDGVELVVDPDFLECLDVAKRLEDGSPELFGEVDFPGRAVAEPKPQDVAGDVANLEHTNLGGY